MIEGNPLRQGIVDKDDVVEGHQTMEGGSRPGSVSLHEVLSAPIDEMKGG